MGIICSKILTYLETQAPLSLAEEWDNVGLLVGDATKEIQRILLCLDVTDDVIAEAIERNVDLIIAHHPLIFKGIKKVTTETVLGKKIVTCIQHGINVIALHTNFDMANGGTNDLLFEVLELTRKQPLCPENPEGFALGRIGQLQNPVTLAALADRVKEKLHLPHIHFVGDREKWISRVGLCTGSCATMSYFVENIKNNCDVYITSDIKHHEAIDAKELGLTLIDATHYGSEALFVAGLAEKLNAYFSEQNSAVQVYESQREQPIFNMS